MGKGDDVQEDGTHGYDDDARGDTLRQRRTGHPRESASITRRKKMLRLEHDTYLREHGDHLLQYHRTIPPSPRERLAKP